TPYKPYTESTQYITAKNPETGEILELRSLPNGVKDELRVSEGKAIIRTKKKILQASDISRVSQYEAQGIAIVNTVDFVDYIGGASGLTGNYILENYPEQYQHVASEMDESNVGNS